VRKVVCYMLMSLDGDVDDPTRYFLAPADRPDLPAFDELMEDNEASVIATQDAVLLGRRMYDEWSRFWPSVDDEPFAHFINRVKKYVVTSSPLTTAWAGAEAVTGPLEPFVRDLKTQPGGDIGVHGSITLAQSLLTAGLVDELQLVVGPTFGLGGRRLFPGLDDVRRLELLSARPTPSGSVLLAYRVP
jgi:dihydrofolate reductase